MPLHILSCLVERGHFQHSSDLELEMMSGGIVQKRVILLWTNVPSFAQEHNYCYYHAYFSSSSLEFFLLWGHKRQKQIWKIFRRRSLAMWWKMFRKFIINIWYTFRWRKYDLLMLKPIHINDSQLLCMSGHLIYK